MDELVMNKGTLVYDSLTGRHYFADVDAIRKAASKLNPSDEQVKVYEPKGSNHIHYESIEDSWKKTMNNGDSKKEIRVQPKKMMPNPKPRHIEYKKEKPLETLKRTFEDFRRKEHMLMGKHPWVPIFYNWLIVVVIVALFISFGIWGMDIHIRHKAEALTASAMAEVQAEANAQEQARIQALAAEQASEEYIVKQMSTSLAKLYYGLKNFEEKYHYNETDFETYGRGVFNRVENKAYSNDLIEVINQKDQWVGYNESNPVIDRYYNMAEKHIKAWRSETIKPISNDFVYAELTENGIYLKNDINANGYARRWRAG